MSVDATQLAAAALLEIVQPLTNFELEVLFATVLCELQRRGVMPERVTFDFAEQMDDA